MADYDIISYDTGLVEEKNEVTDLHAYYMTQFNLEVENSKSKMKNDDFQYGVEESFDFEVINEWSNADNIKNGLEDIDHVLDYNVSDQNIKDVLLDLDSIEFDNNSFNSDSSNDKRSSDIKNDLNTEYIDDESLIDELCREDGETCLTPDFNEDYLKGMANEACLPSIETAFSKRYCNFNNTEECTLEQDNYQNEMTTITNNQTLISSLEQFSYPNNILYNLDKEKKYILPDTPTSCTEFNFDRLDRKLSVSDSIESDVQSSSYYDETTENFDEEELFMNLDDFGLSFEKENDFSNDDLHNNNENNRKLPKDKQGERVCLWEQCYERYPNQSTLVEHIERAHVNTYKGDEFSCLWRDCARGRRPFNARYKLLIHMRVHSGHKPNRCHHPGCGKAFSRLENLKIHVRSHTGERPYACPAPHCRKAFSNSSDRAKHQRTHFNARPYACGAIGCGKRYTDPSSLRKHVKSHPHITNVPRTCIPPTRPFRRAEEQLVPSSPAKLTTLRCIRDKLTVPRLQKL